MGTVAELLSAAERGRLRGLRGLGELKESRVLAAVDAYEADAHGVEELDLPERCGLDVARRGWAGAVLNTLGADALLERLRAGELN